MRIVLTICETTRDGVFNFLSLGVSPSAKPRPQLPRVASAKVIEMFDEQERLNAG